MTTRFDGRGRRGAASLLVVVIAVCAAASCSKDVLAQNKACAQAVDALSANLESISSASAIDATIARNVATTCPDRPLWRISAKVDDIATKLGNLSGVNDSEMTGTSTVALNSALAYLCMNYGPDTASAACKDNN